MSFDFVAPHYRWLEKIVFGSRLEEARLALVREIASAERVLVIGEGDGRFLAEFLKRYPQAKVDCLEASRRMIELARERTAGRQVRFISAPLEQVELAEGCYDLIVTHFFLDCFSERTLPEIVGRIAQSATPGAEWLIAEFQPPASGWLRVPRRWLIRFMYLFFRLVAGIDGRRLIDYRPLLQANGFELSHGRGLPNEMIRSELWRRR